MTFNIKRYFKIKRKSNVSAFVNMSKLVLSVGMCFNLLTYIQYQRANAISKRGTKA